MNAFQSLTDREARPYLVLIIALAAATFAAVFIKLAQQAGMPSPLIAAGRLTLAALVLTPFVLLNYRHELRRLSRRDVLFSLFAGFWLATHFMTIVYALESASVMIVQVIINTGPLWVALLEVTFLREKLNREVWFGLLLTIIGGGVIALASNAGASGGENALIGNGLALAGAIASSIYITIGRSVREKVSLFPYIWMVFGCGALLAMSFVVLIGTPLTGHPPRAYFWLIMVTLIPQLIGHSGFNYALGYFSATIVSLTAQTISVTAAIAAFFIFAEVPGLTDLIGSGIIISGVILAIISRQRKRKSAT